MQRPAAGSIWHALCEAHGQWSQEKVAWCPQNKDSKAQQGDPLVGPLFLGGALFCSAACRAFSMSAPSSSVSVPLEISASSSMLCLLSEAALAGEDRPMCRMG